MATSVQSPETGFLRVDGLDIPFQWWGNRYDQPVLFFHDIGDNPATFAPVCAALVHQGYCCISLGLPFHQQETNRAVDFRCDSFIQKLTETLAYNGLGKYTIVAHSFGARLALPLAVYNPEMVKRIILVAPDGFHSRSDLLFKPAQYSLLQKFVNQFDFPARQLLKFVKPDLAAAQTEPLLQVYRRCLPVADEVDLQANRTMGLLYTIQAPVRIIWGKNDREVPFQTAAEVSQHFRDATVHLLENSGHKPHVDAPDEFNELLLKILKR